MSHHTITSTPYHISHISPDHISPYKDTKNYVIQGKQIVLSIGNYKTRKKYGVKRIDIEEKRWSKR